MFGLDVFDGTVGELLRLSVGGFHCGSGLGSERDIPETVGIVSFADDDDFTVLDNVDIEFCKKSDAVVVT